MRSGIQLSILVGFEDGQSRLQVRLGAQPERQPTFEKTLPEPDRRMSTWPHPDFRSKSPRTFVMFHGQPSAVSCSGIFVGEEIIGRVVARSREIHEPGVASDLLRIFIGLIPAKALLIPDPVPKQAK
jgi:hypothetical protein